MRGWRGGVGDLGHHNLEPAAATWAAPQLNGSRQARENFTKALVKGSSRKLKWCISTSILKSNALEKNLLPIVETVGLQFLGASRC